MVEKVERIEFVDRYSATGTPYPDEGSCKGDCEAMGIVPIYMRPKNLPDGLVAVPEDETDPRYIERWNDGHAREHGFWFNVRSLVRHREFWYWRRVIWNERMGRACDGWHFVLCLDCNGTRRAA